jgi:O-antigen ligase
LENKISDTFVKEFLERKRAFSPFISPNLLANYLVMIIMLCLGIVIHKIKREKPDYLFFITLLCLPISMLTLFLTKSIGGWISLIFSIILFLFLGKLLNKKTIFIVFILILLLGGVWTIRINKEEHFTQPSFSLTKRISYWTETIKIILQHPFKGIGLGNFSLKETVFAHNSYLQIWAEMGLLGLLMWLTIIFLFIKKGLRNIHYERENYYKLGLFLSGASFLIHNFIDFSFFVPQASFLWWVILGLH